MTENLQVKYPTNFRVLYVLESSCSKLFHIFSLDKEELLQRYLCSCVY